MLSLQRQQALLALLARRGSATVNELAQCLQVSDDTIRRDLKRLAAEGRLQKAHGGAVVAPVTQLARTQRNDLFSQQKSVIARSALQHIRPGQTLILDAGSTLHALAVALPDIELTLITNSLDIAHTLSERSNIRLILTGGEWDAHQRLFKGESTLEQLRNLRADLAFLGACAIHPTRGVTATDAGDAAVKRAMLASSQSSILLADQSKQWLCEPWLVAPLHAFDHLHTDRLRDWPAPVDDLPVIHTLETP